MIVRPKCILLVEDNEDDIELTKRALARSNIANELSVVNDGQEALDFLFRRGRYQNREDDSDPCLVLLDIKLPKVSGLEVLRELRTADELPRYPVVMLTSSNEDRDLVESYNLGANSYIRKPVDFAQFVEAVQQLGVYWLVLNEPPSGA
jgi:two-component system, response regulator